MATKYIVNNVTGQTINGDVTINGALTVTGGTSIIPYKVYTALLTQSGGSTEDSISAGTLTIGVTYYINQESTGMDFTNVGAPNNNLGTYFVATGTNPNSWGSGANYTLGYDAGAPVVTVLENTIGNIWFIYESPGTYHLMSDDGLLIENKTFILWPGWSSDDGGASVYDIYMSRLSLNDISIKSYTDSHTAQDNLIYSMSIEIRVYN